MSPEHGRETLFAAMAEGLTSRDSAAALQRLEIGLGFLSFFTLVAVAAAAAAQFRGTAAVSEAIVAGVLAAMTWLVHRRWRRLGARIDADIARRRT